MFKESPIHYRTNTEYNYETNIIYNQLIKIEQQKPFLKNIVLLQVYFRDGRKGFGTGIVTQNHIIVTCAHNLFAPEEKHRYTNEIRYFKQRAQQIFFYYKEYIQDQFSQQRRIKIKQWRYLTDYTERPENDFAVLYFKGIPPIQFFDKLTIKQDKQFHQFKNDIKAKYIYGYPSIKGIREVPQNKKLYGGRYDNFHIDVVKDNPNLLYYICSTDIGSSGSGIVCYMNNGDYVLIGIHTIGNSSGNKGIRLRKELMQFYKNSIKELKRKQIKIIRPGSKNGSQANITLNSQMIQETKLLKISIKKDDGPPISPIHKRIIRIVNKSYFINQQTKEKDTIKKSYKIESPKLKNKSLSLIKIKRQHSINIKVKNKDS